MSLSIHKIDKYIQKGRKSKNDFPPFC